MMRMLSGLHRLVLAAHARGADAERARVLTYLHARADALDAGDGVRLTEDRMLHARRLRSLAEQIEQGLHAGGDA